MDIYIYIYKIHVLYIHVGFPGGASGKESARQCRRHKRCGFDPWIRNIPWRRAWKPLQYSCLENPMDRGAWWAMVQKVAKSQTQLKQLKTHAHTHIHTHTHVSYTHMYCTHIMDSTDSLPFEPPGKPATYICTICIYE